MVWTNTFFIFSLFIHFFISDTENESLQLIVENQESYIKDLSIEFIESQRQGEHGVVLRKTVKQCALQISADCAQL
jgi:hypothetical protein